VEGVAAGRARVPADGHRQLGVLSGQLLDLVLEHRPVVAARRVLPDRLIRRRWDIGYGIHGETPCTTRHRWRPKPSSHGRPRAGRGTGAGPADPPGPAGGATVRPAPRPRRGR